MEIEKYVSGYCKALDGSRTVEVILEDGSLAETDCAYPNCIHQGSCPIAGQIRELEK